MSKPGRSRFLDESVIEGESPALGMWKPRLPSAFPRCVSVTLVSWYLHRSLLSWYLCSQKPTPSWNWVNLLLLGIMIMTLACMHACSWDGFQVKVFVCGKISFRLMEFTCGCCKNTIFNIKMTHMKHLLKLYWQDKAFTKSDSLLSLELPGIQFHCKF